MRNHIFTDVRFKPGHFASELWPCCGYLGILHSNDVTPDVAPGRAGALCQCAGGAGELNFSIFHGDLNIKTCGILHDFNGDLIKGDLRWKFTRILLIHGDFHIGECNHNIVSGGYNGDLLGISWLHVIGRGFNHNTNGNTMEDLSSYFTGMFHGFQAAVSINPTG